jgi:hypothetical protein
MAYSTDADLTEYQPDILALGIDSFTEEHDKAQSDIIRELRAKWYSKKSTDKELDATLLTDSQFKVASVYLVLWKYALPQLTNWVDGDRFLEMIKFYKSRYGEEMADILASGVEYDADGDGVVTKSEKVSIGAGRLTR